MKIKEIKCDGLFAYVTEYTQVDILIGGEEHSVLATVDTDYEEVHTIGKVKYHCSLELEDLEKIPGITEKDKQRICECAIDRIKETSLLSINLNLEEHLNGMLDGEEIDYPPGCYTNDGGRTWHPHTKEEINAPDGIIGQA